ncbi:UNVERIFIED_CONTAM: hypothetical protein FKN15_041484 [Acipenser sinensis]
MNSMSPEVTLNRISPELRPLLSTMVRNGKVGLDSTSCLRITDLKSGCTSLTAGPCCDRFKLHIPYAGETLKWDIIFNGCTPDLPPDFIFGEDVEFLPEPSELHLQKLFLSTRIKPKFFGEEIPLSTTKPDLPIETA